MTRIFSFVGFLYLGLLLTSCAPRSPILSQPGIVQIGPLDMGLHNPIWSPDGKTFVATKSTHGHSLTSEIFIVDLSTGNTRSIARVDYGNLEAQSWAPDGAQIAISSLYEGDWSKGIWLVEVDETNLKHYLTKGYDAAWAPDGNRMAIFSTSLEGGNDKR